MPIHSIAIFSITFCIYFLRMGILPCGSAASTNAPWHNLMMPSWHDDPVVDTSGDMMVDPNGHPQHSYDLNNTWYCIEADVGTLPCGSAASTNPPWHNLMVPNCEDDSVVVTSSDMMVNPYAHPLHSNVLKHHLLVMFWGRCGNPSMWVCSLNQCTLAWLDGAQLWEWPRKFLTL